MPPLYTLPERSYSLQIILYDILPPPTRTTCFPSSTRHMAEKHIHGNLSSSICRICPSQLNHSFIIALESGIYFLDSLLFEIRRVSRVPGTIRWQFLWKTSSKFSSAFRSTHASKPHLIIVNTVLSNFLIFVCSLIFLFFQAFLTVEKHSKT